MGHPAFGQRTPNIGLKIESDETRNFNWHKIDDQFRRVFEMIASLSAGTVNTDDIVIGATVPDTQSITWSAGILAASPSTTPYLTPIATWTSRGTPARFIVLGTMTFSISPGSGGNLVYVCEVTCSDGGVICSVPLNYFPHAGTQPLITPTLPLLAIRRVTLPAGSLTLQASLKRAGGHDGTDDLVTGIGGGLSVAEFA
jgi:hypothetical protein